MRAAATRATEAAEWQLISDVERNTGFFCGQLRENRQASLITIYGTGTLLLAALGVVAVATTPSRQRQGPVPQGS